MDSTYIHRPNRKLIVQKKKVKNNLESQIKIATVVKIKGKDV